MMEQHFFSFVGQDSRLAEAAIQLAKRVASMAPERRYAGTLPRALVVGGFVRDILLGQMPKDIDIEVYGIAPERLEALLNELFPHRVNTVGRSFGILKVHIADDIEFDVSLPRRESKISAGHKGFDVSSDPTMDIVDAARRRDFTMNAIYADPLTGELIDPFDGQADIVARELCIVDPATFGDDPLRVYRAVQFAARFGLTLSPATRHLLEQMVARGDLDELPAERVTDELRKLLLKAECPSIGLTLLRELGIITRDYPELEVLIGTEQEPDWHPEGDVWIHTLMVLDQAAKIIRDPVKNFTKEEQLQVMLGALCHDLGKPSTTKVEDGRIRSKGHEDAGKEPTERLVGRWTFGERAGLAAVAISMNHLKTGMLYRAREKDELTDASYTNAVRKLLKRIYPVSWRVLLAAAEADYRGRTIPGVSEGVYAAGEQLTRCVLTNGLDEAPQEPLIHGRDVLELGVTPGPRVGKLIEAIEVLRDEGKITTHEEALQAAKRILLQDS